MQYYKRQRKALDAFYENLAGIVEQYNTKKKWIVFGSSRISGMIIHFLRVKGIVVDAIIDNDEMRQGKKAFGIDIFKPEKILNPYQNDVIVLIASAHQESMIDQLQKMGYQYNKDVVKVIDLVALMKDFSFDNNEGYVEMTLDEVKKTQMDILSFLHEICQENNLKYCISGGTLLGAVRHGGYIPWDDDIDIVMEINDIKKLSEILKNHPRYKLISMFDPELDYFDDCSLLVDTYTKMDMNRFPIQCTTGVSIDIFLLTGIPDGDAGREYIENARKLESDCYNTLYSREECRKKIDILIDYLQKYGFEESNQTGAVLGSYFYREIFDRTVYATQVPMKFEDREYWAPKGYEVYLKQIFGDYMKLPPIQQQQPHHYFKAYRGE